MLAVSRDYWLGGWINANTLTMNSSILFCCWWTSRSWRAPLPHHYVRGRWILLVTGKRQLLHVDFVVPLHLLLSNQLLQHDDDDDTQKPNHDVKVHKVVMRLIIMPQTQTCKVVYRVYYKHTSSCNCNKSSDTSSNDINKSKRWMMNQTWRIIMSAIIICHGDSYMRTSAMNLNLSLFYDHISYNYNIRQSTYYVDTKRMVCWCWPTLST